jgi:hypothetical protein
VKELGECATTALRGRERSRIEHNARASAAWSRTRMGSRVAKPEATRGRGRIKVGRQRKCLRSAWECSAFAMNLQDYFETPLKESTLNLFCGCGGSWEGRSYLSDVRIALYVTTLPFETELKTDQLQFRVSY